jgi:hypothetical protein
MVRDATSHAHCSRIVSPNGHKRIRH